MSSRWPRLQLFEFNDLAGAHPAVRDTIVESLSRTLDWGRMLDGLVDPFARFLEASGTSELLDLGAGAGGPARILAEALARSGRTVPRFVLTDLYPRVEAWSAARDAHPEAIDFHAAPVDATNVPDDLAAGRARTIINVFHHFPPELATAVLRDAVRGGRGVFVAEGFGRNPLQFANFALAGLPALLANPLLSERHRLEKAVLTWLTNRSLRDLELDLENLGSLTSVSGVPRLENLAIRHPAPRDLLAQLTRLPTVRAVYLYPPALNQVHDGETPAGAAFVLRPIDVVDGQFMHHRPAATP